MSDGVLFHADDVSRIFGAVRAHEDGVNAPPRAKRRVLSDAGSTDCACPYLWILMTWGGASGGSFDLKIRTSEGKNIVIPVSYMESSGTLREKMLAESDLVQDDSLTCTLSAGPLHRVGILIHNKSVTTGVRIASLTWENNSLAGASPYIIPWTPFTHQDPPEPEDDQDEDDQDGDEEST